MPRLSSVDNGWIDWNIDIIELFAFICAFDDPHVGSSTLLNKISQSNLLILKSLGGNSNYEYGLVLEN